jgi:RND family efflux transporter MFP subunit
MPELEAEVARREAMASSAKAGVSQAKAEYALLQARLESAKAGLDESEASIRRTRADVTRWDSELGRIEQLVRSSAVSEGLLDEARGKAEGARGALDEALARRVSAQAVIAEREAGVSRGEADMAAAEAAVRVAEAEVTSARAMLGYAEVVAPFDGVITRRHVDEGHLTAAGNESSTLLELMTLDKVTVVVGVPEVEAQRIASGQKAMVRVQAADGPVVPGVVSRTSWAVDLTSRTLTVEIDLPNPGEALRPGFYALARITTESRNNALTIPLSALIKQADGSAACMVVREGKASRTVIETGLIDGGRAEVTRGLGPEDWVVELSPASLADGQRVEATEAPAKPGKP